jgi:hypothetical protein
MFNVATSLAQRARKFSLRELLIVITVAAPLIFIVVQLGPVETILLATITVVTVLVAAVKVKFYSK